MTVTIPRHWLFAVIVVMVVIVTFLPVCGFEFLNYDDRLNIVDNPHIRNFSWPAFFRFWRQPYEGLYIPLSYTLWGLLARIAGTETALNPVPFHVANLMLHVATVAVIFVYFRLFFNDNWAAAGGALFFGLHPIVVEPVAWITEFRGVLSGFLSVLAMFLYQLYRRDLENCQYRTYYRKYLLATLFYVAALLAKPVALVLPFFVGFMCYCGRPQRTRDWLTDMVPWLVMGLPVAILTKFAQPSSNLSFVPDMWERVLVAGDALLFYFGKLIYPVHLGPDYGRIPGLVLASKWVLLTGLLPWFILAVIAFRKAWPWHAVFGIPFSYLLPVLGFIPFTFQGTSTVADRYFYLGLLGPAVGVAWFLSRSRGRLVRFFVVAVLLSFAVASSMQLRYWRNSQSFGERIVTVNPKSWIAQHSLGLHYHEQEQVAKAIHHYQEAIRLKPNYYPTYFNLAYLMALENDLDRAIDTYEKVLSLKSDFVPAYNNLGALYFRKKLYAKAIAAYEKSVTLKPDFPEGYRALGLLYTLTNRFEESAAAYRKSIALKPTGEALNELGFVCLKLGLLDEAEASFGKAADLDYDTAAGLALLAEKRETPAEAEGH